MTGDDDKDRGDDKRFERTVERLLQTPPKPKRQAEPPKPPKPDGSRRPPQPRERRGSRKARGVD